MAKLQDTTVYGNIDVTGDIDVSGVLASVFNAGGQDITNVGELHGGGFKLGSPTNLGNLHTGVFDTGGAFIKSGDDLSTLTLQMGDDSAAVGEGGYAATIQFITEAGERIGTLSADKAHNHVGFYTRSSAFDGTDAQPTKRMNIGGGSSLVPVDFLNVDELTVDGSSGTTKTKLRLNGPAGTDSYMRLEEDGTSKAVFLWDASREAIRLQNYAAGTADFIEMDADGTIDFHGHNLMSGSTTIWDGGAGHVPSNVVQKSGLDADTLDGLNSSKFLRSDADDTINANLTVGGDFRVMASGTDNGLRVRHGQSDGYGFSDVSGNAVVLVNEQGSKNQAIYLGDTGPGEGGDLFGVSATTSGNTPTSGTETWNRLFSVDGEGDFKIPTSLALGDTKDFTFWVDGDELVVQDNNAVELIRQPKAGPTQFLQGAEIGTIEAPSDSLTQLANASVTAAVAAGTDVGYSFAVDSVTGYQLNGMADGSGGLSSLHHHFYDKNGNEQLGILETGDLRVAGVTLWDNSSNHIPSGRIQKSGLDADTLDGNHASAFASSGHDHDSSYYTKSSADSTFVTQSGGSVTSLDVFNQLRTRAGTDILADIDSMGGDDELVFDIVIEDVSGNTPTFTWRTDMRDGGGFVVMQSGVSPPLFRVPDKNIGDPTIHGEEIWYAGNDGSGSGLDADLLDGNHASDFASSGHNHNGTYANTSGDTYTGTHNMDGTLNANQTNGAVVLPVGTDKWA